MKILSIETATPVAAVALAEGEPARVVVTVRIDDVSGVTPLTVTRPVTLIPTTPDAVASPLHDHCGS